MIFVLLDLVGWLLVHFGLFSFLNIYVSMRMSTLKKQMDCKFAAECLKCEFIKVALFHYVWWLVSLRSPF